MKEIVLASASPRRSELLKQINLDFKVIPSNIDEDLIEGLSPGCQVEELAYRKALSVAKQLDDQCIVIGADTIVVKGGILGKPKDKEDAFQMLKMLQGEWHEVMTGIAVIDPITMKYTKGFEKTRVKMRSLTDSSISAYVDTGEPMDKAGAYGIQGIGALLVERIEGCYFNVVGLPLMMLSGMIDEFGIKIL